MRCIARALTSFSPINFDYPSVIARKVMDYEFQHGSLIGKWYKTKSPKAEWYIYAESRLSGKSCSTLPQGAVSAATFVCDEQEANKTLNLFEKAVSALENNLVFSDVFRHLAYGSDTTQQTISKDETLDKNQTQNLKKSLEACRPEFNENKIIEFRSCLRRSPEVIDFAGKIPSLPSRMRGCCLMVEPKHLIDFSNHLEEERRNYCADAHLYGSVMTTVEICNRVAPKAALKYPAKNCPPELSILLQFSANAWYLTSSDILNPVTVLSATIKEALTAGFFEELMAILNEYTDLVRSKMEAALNAKTTDNSLDLLYEAIPYAHGANVICFTLCTNSHLLDTSKAKMVNGAMTQVNENLTRLKYPFAHQVSDFNGAEWKLKKKILAQLRKTEGEKVIEEYVYKWIEELLLYPRSLKPALLSRNDSG